MMANFESFFFFCFLFQVGSLKSFLILRTSVHTRCGLLHLHLLATSTLSMHLAPSKYLACRNHGLVAFGREPNAPIMNHFTFLVRPETAGQAKLIAKGQCPDTLLPYSIYQSIINLKCRTK